MRLTTRSKFGSILSLLVLVTIASGFIVNGLFFHATSSHAAGGPSYSAATGVLSPSATVNLKQLPKASVSHAISASLPKGARHVHRSLLASSGSNGQISSSPITN